MTPGIIIGLVGLLVAVVALFYGIKIGKKLGGKEGFAAAKHSESLLKEQLRKHTHDTNLLQNHQQRLLELIINLPETVNKMGAARSTSALCRITVRALMDLAGARRVGLFIARGAPPRFKLEVFAGDPRPNRKESFDIGVGKLGQLSELIGVRSHDDVAVSETAYSPADEIFKPDMCVSVRRHDKIYAFIAMDGVEQRDPMTRRVVQMITDIHAVSAEGLAILHKERAKADIDQLTSLFNRRHLDRRLAEEMARAQAYGLHLSVFLFDIDHFKHYNDQNGHQAGDECLQLVASLTRSTTRGSDVVCRYGGEEFLVILLGASREEAWHHAERIRQTIASATFPAGHRQPLGCVSVSGGVACYPRDAVQPSQLIEFADKALYEAKEQGRNRVLKASDVLGIVDVDESGAEIPTSKVALYPPHHGPSAGELVTTPPPTFAPMSSHISESPLPRYHRQVRGAEPIHTPIPQAHPCRRSSSYDSIPSMAHTPVPGPLITPPPQPQSTAYRENPPVTPPPKIEVAVSSLNKSQEKQTNAENEGTYIIRDDPKKIDHTR